MHQVILGLGSNIHPSQNVPRAVELLEQHVKVECLSRAWETPAVGQPGAPDFINAALLVYTRQTANELKSQVIRPIEARLGRLRTGDKNAPRQIDIDILIFDNELIDAKLWEYAFLAVPVAELVPLYTNPENGETLAQAAIRLARQTRFEPRPTVLPGSWQNQE